MAYLGILDYCQLMQKEVLERKRILRSFLICFNHRITQLHREENNS